MKKLIIALAFLLLLGALLRLWIPKSIPEKPDQPIASHAPSQSSEISTMPHTPPPESAKLSQPTGANKSLVPESMRSITSDPSVVELLTTYQKNEVGRVTRDDKGIHQLWEGGRLVFEAQRIGGRSKAGDGTIALDAVTGSNLPIEEAEITGVGDQARLSSSPREIWLVTPDGKKTKVSPPYVDAFAPVLAPRGNAIAFTGRPLSANGFPGSQRLYVGNPTTGQYQVVEMDEHLHHFQIWAVDWLEGGKLVRALQDHGETGGHLKLRQIRVE